MRHDPDVLVVGGGVAGLFCAYHLSCLGGSVAVLERGAVGGAQSCSYGNAGFVGTHGAAPLAGPGLLLEGLRGLLSPAAAVAIRPRLRGGMPRWLWQFRQACHSQEAQAGLRLLADMKQRSLEMLRELCRPADLADRPARPAGLAATLTAPGMVLAFKTPREFERARRAVPQAVARGVPLRALSPGELRVLEPDAEFDVCGALYNEEGAFLRVPDFVVELGRAVRDAGVEIHPHTEVTGFGVTRFGGNGRAVDQVRTTRGDFRPGQVVIAAGAWSGECARALGLRLTLQPVKGYSITVKAPRNAPRRPVLLTEGSVAVSPSGDRLRFGGVLEMSGLDQAISPGRADGLRRTVRAYLPGLTSTETVETWTGLRPCTPDNLPFLGRAEPYRNVFVAAGHGQMGMGLAPVGGKLITQLMAGQPPDLDLAPFRLGRFSDRAAGGTS
jgi:D-amino-acid dehydrogenase